MFISTPSAIVQVQPIEKNVLHVHYMPHGKSSPRTLVIDPNAKWPGAPFTSAEMRVTIEQHPKTIVVADGEGRVLVRLPVSSMKPGAFDMETPDQGVAYGIENTSLPSDNVDPRQDITEGLYRPGGTIAANEQGDGGAPLVFTGKVGVLADSDGGQISTVGDHFRFTNLSRKDDEFFIIVGPPKATMQAVADISGHPPMMPKWTLGFLNSQWGSNEKEIDGIVDEYRAKQIPLDGFILDFDWKAWGEDNYGEWRWNSTSGPGAVAGDKFPDGASGVFAKNLAAKGVKLSGIFKPRILLQNADGTPTQAAAYAKAHHLFFSWEHPYNEYFSNRPALDLDFSKPLTRSWYWQHTLPAYKAGIVGFWNDEADGLGGHSDDGFFLFPNFQFADMQRSFYEGMRSDNNERVWSINRNFYLGAQRYAYAEWSGDVWSDFEVMRWQAIRMLGAIDLGEPHWSMDTGGFGGHPTPELYARWMEFAALVPIMRVHGNFNEKRQPWVYGAQAEADAKAAIDLRYSLMPYMYSYERSAYETGTGIVRPVWFEYPDDRSDAPYQTDEWFFGDSLLAAPILMEGQAHRHVYLPPGTWYDWFRGTSYNGKQEIVYKVDPDTWADIPLFVRSGSIVPMQGVQQYVGEHPVTDVTLEIFPATTPATFPYYDDDGTTYDYEKGVYFKQQLSAVEDADTVTFNAAVPEGTYKPALRTFELRVHGIHARAVTINGVSSNDWQVQRDRFGDVTILKVPAGVHLQVELQW